MKKLKYFAALTFITTTALAQTYIAPPALEFKIQKPAKSTDCSRIQQLIDQLTKINCSTSSGKWMCDSLKKSISYEAKRKDDGQNNFTFLKEYNIELKTNINSNRGMEDKTPLRFDILYPSSATLSFLKPADLSITSKSSSILATLVSEISNRSSYEIKTDPIPKLLVSDRLLACALEKNALFFNGKAKIYFSYEQPLALEKEKILTRILEKALELNQSDNISSKKFFELGVVVGHSLSEFRDRLDNSNLSETAEDIQQLILNLSTEQYQINTKALQISEFVSSLLRPGYVTKESDFILTVRQE